jgi:outer membrane protein OmpA-like peptidoglycan-associated protein
MNPLNRKRGVFRRVLTTAITSVSLVVSALAIAPSGVAFANPPINAVLPHFMGTGDENTHYKVGDGMTLHQGTWANYDATAPTYKWYTCTTTTSTSPKTDSNCTYNTTFWFYTVMPSDANKYVYGCVTLYFYGESTTACTHMNYAVAGQPATNVDPPRITDTTTANSFKVGDALSTTDGTWTGTTGSYTYKWYRCTANTATDASTDSSCTAISGATNSTYTLVSADNTKYVTVVVTGTGTDGSTTTSMATFPKQISSNPPATMIAAPTMMDITGSYAVGDTLQFNPGSWSNTKLGVPSTLALYVCTANTVTDPVTDSRCSVHDASVFGGPVTILSTDTNKYLVAVVTVTGTDNVMASAISNFSDKVGAAPAPSCTSNYVVCSMTLSFADSTHGTLSWSGPKGYSPGTITGYTVLLTQQGSSPQTLCTITSAATTTCDFSFFGVRNTQAQFTVYPMAGVSRKSPGELASTLPVPYGVGGTVGATGLILGWTAYPLTNAVVIEYTVNGKHCIQNSSQGNANSGISFSGDCAGWSAGSQKTWSAQAESGWLAPNHTYNVTGTTSQTLSVLSTGLNGFPQAPSSITVTDSFAFSFKTLPVAAPRPSNVSFVDNGDKTYTVTWTNPSGTLPSYAGATGYNADGNPVISCSPQVISAGTNSCTTSAPYGPNGSDPTRTPVSFDVTLYWNVTSTNLLSISQGQPQQYTSFGATYTSGVAELYAISWLDDAGNGSAVTVVTTPNTPTGVNATPGNQQITVTWTAPSGSNAPTSYTVSIPGQTDCTIDLVANPSATLSCTFTGLTNGTNYTATVVANNDSGSSSGATAAATPRTTPGAPTNVTATAGNGSATVSWTAPTNNGGAAITSYTVTASPGGATCTVNAPATTCTVSGLTNGTSYTFTVKATNTAGNSTSSAPSSSVAPQATAPSAPTNVSATGDDGVATISWTAPSNDGGSPIDGYIVTANPGGLTCTAVAPTTTCTITGLDNGTTYTFSVVATNNVGNSDPSSPSNSVTPGAAPSAPDYVQGTPSSHSVRIDWKAPTSGPAPVRYTVRVTPGGQTCTVDLGLHPSAALSCNFTGLTNGTPYTFTVTGVLANGNSTSDSINVVPNSGTFKPTAPRQVVFRGAVNGVTTVTWKVPASNGGSTITKYTAFVNGSRLAKSCTVNMVAKPTATLKCTFTGLKPKRFYSYRVVAVNGIGQAASVKTKRAIDISVRVVSFARGKSTLWSGLQRQAVITAKYIKRYKYTKVVVTGYTNPFGSQLSRTTFTQARALTVANYLVKRLKALGVKNVQVSASGTGASLYRHPNAKQKKLNRSVGTLLTYK